jgi:hypothetical protein
MEHHSVMNSAKNDPPQCDCKEQAFPSKIYSLVGPEKATGTLKILIDGTEGIFEPDAATLSSHALGEKAISLASAVVLLPNPHSHMILNLRPLQHLRGGKSTMVGGSCDCWEFDVLSDTGGKPYSAPGLPQPIYPECPLLNSAGQHLTTASVTLEANGSSGVFFPLYLENREIQLESVRGIQLMPNLRLEITKLRPAMMKEHGFAFEIIGPY